jgi:hypothetical protein
MSSEYLDRLALGISRVAQQYSESPNFLAWLTELLKLQQDSEDCLQQMALQTAIDIAQGVNLYAIAVIVGAPIVIGEAIASNFIAFQDQTGGYTFADATDPAIVGGVWREAGELEGTLEDLWNAQRLVIRATIVKNHSLGSGESIQRGLMYLFPNCHCIVTDNHDMSFNIGIGRLLSPLEHSMILQYDVLPRPAGVLLNQVIAFDDPVFGFEDTTGAETFDIGHWANLQYGTAPALYKLPEFLLIPTTR